VRHLAREKDEARQKRKNREETSEKKKKRRGGGDARANPKKKGEKKRRRAQGITASLSSLTRSRENTFHAGRGITEAVMEIQGSSPGKGKGEYVSYRIMLPKLEMVSIWIWRKKGAAKRGKSGSGKGGDRLTIWGPLRPTNHKSHPGVVGLKRNPESQKKIFYEKG